MISGFCLYGNLIQRNLVLRAASKISWLIWKLQEAFS